MSTAADDAPVLDRTRRVEYMKLADIAPADANPKRHDLDELREMVETLGWLENVIMDERTGKLVGGHGRRDLSLAMEIEGADVPEGVIVDDDGDWTLPVNRGWASRDDDHAKKALVALNRGGQKAGWDQGGLFRFLDDLDELSGTGFAKDEHDELGRELGELARRETDFLGEFTDSIPGTPGAAEKDPDDDGDRKQDRQALSGTTKVADSHVLLELPMTVDERAEVVAAVQAVKRERNLDTFTEALLVICRAYPTAGDAGD